MKNGLIVIILAAIADVALLVNIWHWWGCACG